MIKSAYAPTLPLIHPSPVFKSLRPFIASLLNPLNAWIRLRQEISELASLDYRSLRDLGVSNADFLAIQSRTFTRGSHDLTGRIIFHPENRNYLKS